MNIERFHAIAKAILEDLQSFNYQVKLAELLQHLKNKASQPAQPSFAQAVDQALIELRDRLPKLSSNRFSQTWLQHMHEHSLNLFIGNELLREVEDILRENALTPSVSDSQLTRIVQQLSDGVQSLRNFIGAMERFCIGAEDVDAGTAELGVLIPRKAVKNDVHTFGKELTRLSKLVGAFQEVSTGSRAELRIRSVSSSDLSIFFLIDPVTAKLWLDALNALLDAFKSIQDIRKSIHDLKANGVPEAATAALEEHANSRMEATVLKVVDEVLDGGGRVVKRKTELRVELRSALSDIALRLDNGFNFEVRAKPDDQKVEDEDAQGAAENAALKAVQAGSSQLRFLKLDGNPILKLPSATADEDSSASKGDEAPKKSKK
ncbi:MAG: hypothetical protein KBA31_17915 [Alphaproteobacteria bacterium]|nr:hypothetical protein [Alphaproteobacteria bacterium]